MEPSHPNVRPNGHPFPSSEHARHRALAGISRSRLLAVLRGASQPMGISQLAAAIDLHPNTVREHLDRLVEAGLVTRATSPPAGRGRPGLRYAAERSSTEADPHAYRALAAVLVEELARRDDAVAAAVGAGERWGAGAAGTTTAGPGAVEAVDRLTDVLDGLGFAPERGPGPGVTIRLHRCPFGSLARQRSEVVCNVHLGLMRGALRELGADFASVSLQPFAEPDLCLAHVGLGTDDPYEVEP